MQVIKSLNNPWLLPPSDLRRQISMAANASWRYEAAYPVSFEIMVKLFL